MIKKHKKKLTVILSILYAPCAVAMEGQEDNRSLQQHSSTQSNIKEREEKDNKQPQNKGDKEKNELSVPPVLATLDDILGYTLNYSPRTLSLTDQDGNSFAGSISQITASKCFSDLPLAHTQQKDILWYFYINQTWTIHASMGLSQLTFSTWFDPTDEIKTPQLYKYSPQSTVGNSTYTKGLNWNVSGNIGFMGPAPMGGGAGSIGGNNEMAYTVPDITYKHTGHDSFASWDIIFNPSSGAAHSTYNVTLEWIWQYQKSDFIDLSTAKYINDSIQLTTQVSVLCADSRFFGQTIKSDPYSQNSDDGAFPIDPLSVKPF